MSDQPRKFYKPRIVVEVLSEDEPLDSNLDLKQVAHEIDEGDCSGQVTWEDPVLLTPEQAAKALEEQGSDPGFFRLAVACKKELGLAMLTYSPHLAGKLESV